ncbi:GNAT family N-acetyltransferase [Virgibacillus byunsanensis]|uniref:GNAT family N-acetyltransferase n=1 Tax=Virgibacillus byunsanensis TaxID=570945 RepID=A0ABW3LR35_9BACI
MKIREATINETNEILKYAQEVFKESTMGHMEPSLDNALQLVSPFLSEGGHYLVYLEGSKIKGWIGVGKTYDMYTDETIGIIPEVYVLPPFRKQGIAKKLCIEALNHFIENGYNKVQLYVFSGNHVKELYHKLGFQEISILMEKTLDD